jgi:phosphoesterase RecJ-like protein
MEAKPTDNANATVGCSEQVAKAAECLKQVRRPAIVGHITPDADCLASQFALATVLQARGTQPRVVIPPGSISQRLQFMLPLAGTPTVFEDLPEDADWVLVVDTAMARRVNLPDKDAKLAGKPIFNLDHHVTNDDFGRVNCVDPQASSSAEIVWRVLRAMDVDITPQVASLLYCGLYGDTSGFSLPNTTPSSLHVAADLVSRGADVAHIGEQLLRSMTRHDFDLLRTVFDNTRVIADGRIAYSTVTYEELTRSGCSAADIDDQVSIPRALRTVELAMLFSEGQPGIVRVNFRGEGGLSVLPLAKAMGGGGHLQSAGTKIRGPFEPTVQKVLDVAAEYLRDPAAFNPDNRAF